MSTLVLLVGLNPLPNWVIFAGLMRPEAPRDLRPSRVLLVCSHRTASVAERLRERIQPVVPVAVSEPLDARDGVTLRRGVTALLDRWVTTGTVHLNYTGGTKEMAVSAYAAATALAARKSGIALSFSYLDADSFRLRFQDRRQYPEGEANLRRLVALPTDELFALHAWQRVAPAPRRFKFAWDAVATAIAAAVLSDDGARAAYREWLRPFSASDGSLIKAPSPDAAPPFAYPSHAALSEVRTAILTATGLPAQAEEVSWTRFYETLGARNRDERKSLWDEFGGFFHGKWLEWWIGGVVRTGVRGDPTVDLARNVEVRPTGGGIPAELDVVLTRGYQLYLFSCSTATSRSHLKSKGFEAFRRSQQFGGDESRAVLVTLCPRTATGQAASVEGLRQDLSAGAEAAEGQDRAGGDRRLSVWGIEELRDVDRTWETLWQEEATV